MKLINDQSKAFSLIELLVVVAILGILSSIAIVSYGSYLDNSRARTLEHLLLELQAGFQSCYVYNSFDECDTIAKIEVQIPINKYTITQLRNASDQVCFQLESKRNQNHKGCFSTIKYTNTINISTLEDIKDSSKGECDTNATCT